MIVGRLLLSVFALECSDAAPLVAAQAGKRSPSIRGTVHGNVFEKAATEKRNELDEKIAKDQGTEALWVGKVLYGDRKRSSTQAAASLANHANRIKQVDKEEADEADKMLEEQQEQAEVVVEAEAAKEEALEEVARKKEREARRKRLLKVTKAKEAARAHLVVKKVVSRKTEEAAQMMSGLMLNASLGADLERWRCEKYHLVADKQLCNAQQAEQDDQERLFRTESAVQQVEQEAADIQQEIEKMSVNLREQKERCQSEQQLLKSRATRLQKDLEMAETTYALSPCKGSTMLLQCKPRNMHSYFTFGHRDLKAMMSQLSSVTAHRALQDALASLYRENGLVPKKKPRRHHDEDEDESDDESDNDEEDERETSQEEDGVSAAPFDASFLQRGRTHHRLHRHGRGRQRHESRAHARALSAMKHRLAVRRKLKMAAECTVNRMANCQVVQEAMILMMAAVQDKMLALAHTEKAKQDDCDAVRQDFMNQVKLLNQRSGKLQINLASYTYVKGQLREELRLKQEEVVAVSNEWSKNEAACKDNLKGYEDKLCNLRQTRAALGELDGKEDLQLEDCEVSDWIPGACSAECGGGDQNLTRHVIKPAGLMGMQCPQVMATQACNSQPCPVDCETTEWTAWSDCSALCGGGTKTRDRTVSVRSAFGGQACPEENSEVETCNVNSCDSDCDLGIWSEWASCSRACGGGFRGRYKSVLKEAHGTGYCPSEDARMQYQQCNKGDCVLPGPGLPLMCNSTIDLTIVVDGSSSVGSEGFNQLKAFISALVKQLQVSVDKAQVAVVMMSGPTTWETYRACNEEQYGTFATCNVAIAVPMSSDPAALETAVQALAWPGNTLYTAGALQLAATALSQGRTEAQGVVLVLQHGRPLSLARTAEAAGHLREKARVMWTIIGNDAGISAEDAAAWASKPARDNVVRARNFQELTTLPKLSEFVSSFCPKLTTTQSSVSPPVV